MKKHIVDLFNDANQKGYSIPAYNFTNATMFKTIVETAEKNKAPVLVTLSEAHLNLISLKEAVNLYNFYKKIISVPIVLHFDHGMTIEVIKEAIDLGFPSVMIDASKENFENNVRFTKEIVDYAKEKNVFVEAEIGHVGSSFGTSEADISQSIYTEVEEAIEFYQLTGVDSLAVSIGTSHGAYRGEPHLNFERLEELSDSIEIPLVLHGGSSSGDENLSKASKYNIAKINVFTDVINAATKKLDTSKDYIEIIEQLNQNMSECIEHYIKVFETEKWGQ